MPCEMTTRRTSLAAAIVAVEQHDGVALHAVHLIAKVVFLVDGSWDTRKTTPQRVPCLDSCHTRLASAGQHRPRRGDDGVGHENDGLPGLRRNLSLLLSLTEPEDRRDRRRHSGNPILLHLGERRMVRLAVLFVSFQGGSARSVGMPSFSFFRIPTISPV